MDLDSFEIRDHVARALNDLKPQFRQAFILRELHGLDYKTIARIEKCPINTIKTRIHRAKKYLMLFLQDEYQYDN